MMMNNWFPWALQWESVHGASEIRGELGGIWETFGRIWEASEI